MNGDDFSNNDYLLHYGVLGMKWGVRNNPSKAFSKASRKADKLQNKANSNNAKYQKASMKESKYNAKYSKASYKNLKNNSDRSKTKMDKVSKKYNNVANKSAEYALKYRESSQKADNWINDMKNVFSNVNYSDIDNESAAVGKNYIYMLRQG